MRIPRIYLPAELVSGASVRLSAAAFGHVVRVLRLGPGSPLVLFNGTGGAYCAVLTAVTRREAIAQVGTFDPSEAESPLQVMLLQGVAKGERMDTILQKAVELGAYTVQPLITARSVGGSTGERLERRMQHWRGVVTGACEQSGRNRVPEVLDPRNLKTGLESCPRPRLGLMLDPRATDTLTQLCRPTFRVALLVGPEGGLADDEKSAAAAAGFTGVGLGPRVLRTETAGAAALAILQSMWGDLG